MHVTVQPPEHLFAAASVTISGALPPSWTPAGPEIARKDLKHMHAKTALAVAGSVLAAPSAALAASPDNHASDRDALHPSGKLTHDEGLKGGLVRTNVRLSRRLDRKPNVRRLRTLSVSALRGRNAALRKRLAQSAPATPPHLEAIAACESGGNPSTDTGNGFYGKYQFDQSTWQSVGGTGNPAAASEAEQDKRAAMLYQRAGASPWPVCGA
jgi:hypothetical protein